MYVRDQTLTTFIYISTFSQEEVMLSLKSIFIIFYKPLSVQAKLKK